MRMARNSGRREGGTEEDWQSDERGAVREGQRAKTHNLQQRDKREGRRPSAPYCLDPQRDFVAS